MADISKIKLPSGTEYNLKDASARADIQSISSQIEALTGGDAIVFAGISSAELTDGGTESAVIDGEPVAAEIGQLFFYGTQEFIYGPDNKWHALGSLDSLGALAYKNSASGTVTPTGTVSQPTFTGSSLTSTGTFTPSGSVSVSAATTSNATATVSPAGSGDSTYTPAGSVSAPTISVSSAGSTQAVAKTVAVAAPGETAPANSLTYYAVANETLSLYQLGYTTETVKTGDASYSASTPSFTGTGVRLVTGNIAVPATYTASFTGTEGNLSVSGTPAGTVSQPTFTGDEKTVNVS